MTATPQPPPPPPPPPPTPTPGPTPGPPQARPPQPRKPGTWPVAIAALVVSLLALVVAATSFMGARAAQREAADAARAVEASPAGNGGARPPATGDPVGRPTTGDPLPSDHPGGSGAPPQSFNPQAEFTMRYSGEVLNPRVTSNDDAYVDLDEPRVVFDASQADLVIEEDGLRSNPPYFDLQQSNLTAAEAGSPTVTPEECLERIRTSPLPPSAEVPAQRGVVLCLLTSLSRAAEQGINQKLVVLHVSAIGDEGRVTLDVTAWEQPR